MKYIKIIILFVILIISCAIQNRQEDEVLEFYFVETTMKTFFSMESKDIIHWDREHIPLSKGIISDKHKIKEFHSLVKALDTCKLVTERHSINARIVIIRSTQHTSDTISFSGSTLIEYPGPVAEHKGKMYITSIEMRKWLYLNVTKEGIPRKEEK